MLVRGGSNFSNAMDTGEGRAPEGTSAGSSVLESDAALPLSGKCHMVLASFC